MNFFKDTKSRIIFSVGLVVVVICAFFVLYFSDSYSTKHKNDKVEPVIELTTDKIIIPTGSEFNAKDYIKTATDSEGKNIIDKIKSPELDTKNAGTYEITYAYKDGETIIKSKVLKVIVANK